ncbi:MAG: GAF domain-containing protein [Syntrophaceae bacterium]|nr:GAF domain-containing protein [Syntrophaceae bacterium]
MRMQGLFDWFSIENKGLYYKLYVVFGLFFLVPVFGFLYFAVKYDILNDEFIPIYFITLLLLFFFGFFLLRKLADDIISLSHHVNKTLAEDLKGKAPMPAHTDEMKGIIASFHTLEQELRHSFQKLDKKSQDITTLKELADLCYITFNPDDLLHITLERALKLVDADIGSVLILERPRRDVFQVVASIGLGGMVKKGDRISYAESVAKYAVINRTPLVVEDIESDTRFGRVSRRQYATKSFICMPLKTIHEVIGVVTISRSRADVAFRPEDAELLSPLLSNAAFTYDNIQLIQRNERQDVHLASLENVIKAINSSLKPAELVQMILHEVHQAVPYDVAVLVIRDRSDKGGLLMNEVLAFAPTNLTPGPLPDMEGSILERTLRMENLVILRGGDVSNHPLDRLLFGDVPGTFCILAPLSAEGGSTGALVLQNVAADALAKFKDYLEAITQGLSLALEKQRLILSALKRNQELDAIRQIGSALSTATFDMEKVLNYTMDMIREAINVEAGTLFLVEGDDLRFQAAFNIDLKSIPEIRIKLGQGIAGYCASRGEAIISEDVRSNPHFYSEIDGRTNFNTRSVLCVPMISQSRVIGVIEVINKIGAAFDESDKSLLQSIAASVSIAIENAHLYRETRTMAEKERSIRSVFQKYVPKAVVDEIILSTESGRSRVEEFKTVTLLNIDIRNFSLLSRDMGPQKTVALLNDFFAVMGEIVFRQGGIVDKYLGDGFLAIFGAPVSGPADAENAVQSALEMMSRLEDLNGEFQRRFSASLVVGIAVHTGEVVVGNIGFEKKMDYTVIGDAVNVLFRIQDLCHVLPNSILMSGRTRRSTQSNYQVEEVTPAEPTDAMGSNRVFRLLGRQETA